MTESNPDKLYDDARKLKDQGDLEGCVTSGNATKTLDVAGG